jgi:hypothetical protein
MITSMWIAVESGSENDRLQGGKGYGNHGGHAQIYARMQQVFVEMCAPEFGFKFLIESEPGKARVQLPGLGGIRQICGRKAIRNAHSPHRTHLRLRTQ